VNQLVELGIQVIAIDGKNLRVPMSESGSKALHFVSVGDGTSVGVGTQK